MPYLPEFKGPVEGYVVNFLSKNLWRVKNTHDHDDAMQEARKMFLTCVSKYPIVETPQHFMALFKTAWANEFTDLSNKATEARRMVAERTITDESGDEHAVDQVGELDNDGTLAVMVRQAPQEVIMVLNLMLVAPQELLDLAMTTWRKNGKYKADGEKAVARMLGLPADAQPLTKTRAYFGDQ